MIEIKVVEQKNKVPGGAKLAKIVSRLARLLRRLTDGRLDSCLYKLLIGTSGVICTNLDLRLDSRFQNLHPDRNAGLLFPPVVCQDRSPTVQIVTICRTFKLEGFGCMSVFSLFKVLEDFLVFHLYFRLSLITAWDAGYLWQRVHKF